MVVLVDDHLLVCGFGCPLPLLEVVVWWYVHEYIYMVSRLEGS